MYRIRFHGRGGQGIKTASRILGSSLFLSGLEVQDAPRYGAERRGAPISAYVRAGVEPIRERGVILDPDLVIVTDDTLVSLTAAGALVGVDERTCMLLATSTPAEEWRHRLHLRGPLFTLSPATDEAQDGSARAQRAAGVACLGAAARLLGVVPRDRLAKAVAQEMGSFGPVVVARSQESALEAFDAFGEHEGSVAPSPPASASSYAAPDWLELPFESARVAAPAIHAAATSVEVRTGLWRTLRPVIDLDLCRQCWWVCSSLCPDNTIEVGAEGYPVIDYDHCKGCMICVAQCPPHAIGAVPEASARIEEAPA